MNWRAFIKKIKRVPGLSALMHARLRDAIDTVVDLRTVDPEAAVMLALQYGLSAYEAAYLWLARNLELGLVTLDGRLERALRSH